MQRKKSFPIFNRTKQAAFLPASLSFYEFAFVFTNFLPLFTNFPSLYFFPTRKAYSKFLVGICQGGGAHAPFALPPSKYAPEHYQNRAIYFLHIVSVYMFVCLSNSLFVNCFAPMALAVKRVVLLYFKKLCPIYPYFFLAIVGTMAI